jgi:hypothetical protein
LNLPCFILLGSIYLYKWVAAEGDVIRELIKQDRIKEIIEMAVKYTIILI